MVVVLSWEFACGVQVSFTMIMVRSSSRGALPMNSLTTAMTASLITLDDSSVRRPKLGFLNQFFWPRFKPIFKPDWSWFICSEWSLVERSINWIFWFQFELIFAQKIAAFFTILPCPLMTFIIVEVAYTVIFMLKLAVPTTTNRYESRITTNPQFTTARFY